MATNSLVKFMNGYGTSNGQKVFWGRADVDGAPYRGEPIMAPQEELDERLTRVADPKNQLFDLSNPDDNKAYLEVLNKVTNGWGQMLCEPKRIEILVERKLEDGTIDRDVKIKVYIEWAEYYMEDGKPMHAQRPYVGRPND